MSVPLTFPEKVVLAAILEGDHPALPELRSQIDILRVSQRKAEYHHYSALLVHDNGVESRLTGTIRNCDIGGTVVEVLGTESHIVAHLQIRDGIIRYLALGGPYDVPCHFNVEGYHWENARVVAIDNEPKVQVEVIRDAGKRDWKKAISYKAMYL